MTTTPMSGTPDTVRHAPAPVAEQAGATPRHPVVVVGAGPVGMTLALLLARRGVPTVVLEAADTVGVGSRAICLAARSLEILEQAGAGERVLATALPWTGGRSFVGEHLVGEFTMAADGRHPPMVNLAQDVLEGFLVAAIDDEPLVDLRWSSTVTAIEQDDDGTRLAVASPLGDHTVTASWAVACDGPRSPLREMLGLTLEGESHEGRYVIVDLHLRSERPTERLCWFDPPTFPGKTVLLHKQPHDIWRLDYQVDPGQSLEQATDPAVVLPRVAAHLDWIGETAPWSLEWLSSYRAHSLSLADYRHGHVLFAGDAAHLVPIFGVRGLNGGLADALNLAWKLALVVAGPGGEELLDSYTVEQRAAALENMAAAGASARFMSPENPARRLLRDAALSLAVGHPEFRVLVDPRQTRPASYIDSPLSTTDDEHWSGGPAPGVLAPDLAVGPELRGRSVQETLGLGFVLLVCGGTPVDDPGSVPVVRVSDAAAVAAFDGAEGAVYLLRPDRYVAARWRRPTDTEIRAGLARASGERLDAHA